jgi:hypothetical protein
MLPKIEFLLDLSSMSHEIAISAVSVRLFDLFHGTAPIGDLSQRVWKMQTMFHLFLSHPGIRPWWETALLAVRTSENVLHWQQAWVATCKPKSSFVFSFES